MKAMEEKNIKTYLKSLKDKKKSWERALAAETEERDVFAGLPTEMAGSKMVQENLKSAEDVIKQISGKIAEFDSEINSCEKLLKK